MTWLSAAISDVLALEIFHLLYKRSTCLIELGIWSILARVFIF